MIFDTQAFDDKHQHVLLPTSLITGTVGIFAEKMRDHVLTFTKSPPPNVIGETTAVRPTLIDFIAKIKKRSIQINKDNCSENSSFVDGISEQH